MKKIILIRHGETNYNRQKRYCGFSDISINRAGCLQAGAVRPKLKEFKIQKVFCSDLKRSLQTAKIIFGASIKNIAVSASLREMNFGAWEGLTYQQIFKKNPRIYRKWLDDPFCVDVPSGERMDNFVRRVQSEFHDIVNTDIHTTVAIVSHLGPMRVILNACQNGRCPFWDLHIEPRSIYIIEYNGAKKPKVYTR